MKLRHQLAAYSPVTPTSIVRALLASAGMGGDAAVALRARLVSRYAADDCVLCGSGTQALQHAIATALTHKKRDGFIALPAFNCYDMASAALGAGVRVALYDVNPLTLAPDLASFERVLASGASAAVVAYLYGVPFEWEAVAGLARRFGVPLIEDAAQGHGASWRDTPLGALGRLSIVSFGRGKGWTGGNGGALLLRDIPLSLVAAPETGNGNARTTLGLAAQWLLGRPALYGAPRAMPGLALGETVYHSPSAVSSMPIASAAAALATEEASTSEADCRRANARRLSVELAGGNAERILVPSGAEPGYIRFPLLRHGGMQSLPARASALGISASYPTTLAQLPSLQASLVSVEEGFPGAERLVRELVTLPVHSRVSDVELSEIAEMVRKA